MTEIEIYLGTQILATQFQYLFNQGKREFVQLLQPGFAEHLFSKCYTLSAELLGGDDDDDDNDNNDYERVLRIRHVPKRY